MCRREMEVTVPGRITRKLTIRQCRRAEGRDSREWHTKGGFPGPNILDLPLGVSDRDRGSSKRSARLVRQREEVLVEPKSVEADIEVLVPISSANGGSAVRPHHIREWRF